ncbi:siderophore ABC transporter substrate-binding protein [Roseibium sp. RKSG952]|uniref:siderophore ABC transporter substrate-binding protein n=1 Tax=Roseibium sp. RKSG952 TaxID=2529384 RepID=UPI0012BBB830|nr:siderophore ABC transporter substrate-binding protein [Roseibium sp. RKSG952]MTH95607.1 siderophore ABC transporter substrate-binding protein [Roseibium sp. RKSG952]
MRHARWIATLLAFGLSSQIALAETVAVNTAAGPVDVSARPETIAVFDISAVDTLSALGVSIEGVPQRIYVDHLEEAVAGAEIVGSLFEPDFEAVNALQPDLIVAGGRSSTQVKALSELAPTIDMTIWGDGLLNQAKSRLEAYGELFGKQPEAAELEAKLDAAVSALKTQTSGAGSALIVMTNGPKVSVYGQNSRFGWLYSELGIQPAGGEIKASNHGEAVSFEFIRETNPDWLIVIDRAAAIGNDTARARETLDNKLIADTKAWQSGQVIYLNAANVYIAAGGYQSLMATIGQLSDAFAAAD